MATRKFTKEYLCDVLDHAPGWVSSEVISTDRRWSNDGELIFKADDDLFYSAIYSVGATEMQDEGPWEYMDDDAEIECTQVHEVEVLVKQWVAVA